ncbi:MAG: hypothetical protein RIF33_13510 [Cyclobacteriaceae bacterium]
MNNEEIVIAGFNHGYLLATQAPKILKEYVAIGNSLSPYARGYAKGVMHAVEEVKAKKKGAVEKNTGKRKRGNDMGM